MLGNYIGRVKVWEQNKTVKKKKQKWDLNIKA